MTPTAMASTIPRYAVALEQPVRSRIIDTTAGVETISPLGPSSLTISVTWSGVAGPARVGQAHGR